MNDIIRIGTRKSALALIQTQLVADELRQVCPGIQVEIVTKDTLGTGYWTSPYRNSGARVSLYLSLSRPYRKAS